MCGGMYGVDWCLLGGGGVLWVGMVVSLLLLFVWLGLQNVSVPERSKGVDSSSTVFALVGSNPTADTILAFYSTFLYPFFHHQTLSNPTDFAQTFNPQRLLSSSHLQKVLDLVRSIPLETHSLFGLFSIFIVCFTPLLGCVTLQR